MQTVGFLLCYSILFVELSNARGAMEYFVAAVRLNWSRSCYDPKCPSRSGYGCR